MRYIYIFIIYFCPLSIIAQQGGLHAFSFVNVIHSARIDALGGSGIAIYDNDISLSTTNPSLLNPSMNNKILFTYGDYFSDINLLSCVYVLKFKQLGTLGFAVQAVNYGNFERNDIFGYNQGSFSAHDQVITLGIGKKIHSNFSIGVNIKLLNSHYDFYNAFALSSNISTTYINQGKRFSSTLLIKNIGRGINHYSSLQEQLPWEAQIAISKELEHLPFRYHLSYNNIMNFNIKSPYKLLMQTNIETGELELKQESFAKTALRHIIIGGELNPFRKSLFIRGGFNFQRRFDMTTINKPAMIGFSWGIGFRVFKYYFDYSRSAFHLSGILNNFSISTNLSSFGI